MLLNLSNSKNSIGQWNQSFLKHVKIYKQGTNLISGSFFSGVDSTVQPSNHGKFIRMDSLYVSVGAVYDQNSQTFESVYSINTNTKVDSISTFKISGLSIEFRNALPHPSNDSTIIIYGSAQMNSNQKWGYFMMEFNLVDKSYNIQMDSCWSNNYTELLYDELQNIYIATSYRPLCNGVDSLYGSSFGYLDSNFNLTTPVSDHIDIDYTPYMVANREFSSDLTAMEWASDSTIMVVGNIFDPLNIPKPASSNSILWGNDIGVSIRRASNFTEIDLAKTYGIVDVAEVYHRPNLVKMDSNLFVTAANLEMEGVSAEPWNTELALLGLNENGDKHWMKYFPFNDYCWVQDIHPDDDEGLWVVAQCEEMPNSQAYEQFAKVMYIDSVAHWPRIGTVGISEADNFWDNEFKIFPNPADKNVTIRNYSSIQKVDAKIFDVNGRLVKAIKMVGRENTFDVSELKAGMYFVKIHIQGEGIASKKLMIR